MITFADAIPLWRMQNGPNNRWFRLALAGSFLVHSVIGIVALLSSLLPTDTQEPLTVDLTTLPLPSPGLNDHPQGYMISGQQQHKPTVVPRNTRPAPLASPVATTPSPSVIAQQTTVLKPTEPLASHSFVPVSDVHTSSAIPVSAGAGTGEMAGSTNAGPGIGTGNDQGATGEQNSGSMTVETLRTQYLAAHFAYIRDLIGQGLRYPRQALRMGWHGRVTVSFLVQVDGSATSLQVVHSSGVPLLDSNAIDTVRLAAPFPKPPVSARLLIPVDYRLD